MKNSAVAPLLLVAWALAAAEPRPYLRHKNANPAAYLSREMPDHLILGEVLFKSPFILNERLAAKNISCHTCHPNGAAADKLTLAGNADIPGVVDLTHKTIHVSAENGKDDPLRIPSLRGIRYLAPYGHDGRMQSLHDFTRDIVHNTFGGASLAEDEVAALTAYMMEFDFLPNPRLTATGRLADGASSQEKKGEKLFMNSGCSRCHDAETYFTDGKVRRLAGQKTFSPFSFENGLKTPTLLRAARTRYLHDGSADFNSLLTKHAAQVETKIDEDDTEHLKSYLRVLMTEEKPADERHIAERAAELNSWLKLFEGDLPRSRQALVLKTLQVNFAALRGEIRTARDRYFMVVYLDGLNLLSEMAGRQTSRVMRTAVKNFQRRMAPGLRFFGT